MASKTDEVRKAQHAADAETIKSLDEQRLNNDRIMSNLRKWLAEARKERDAVKEALVEAREAVRKQSEEIERLRKVRTGSAVERLHNLCDGFEESDKAQEAELALRAQVETLREALKDIKAKADFQIPPYAYGDNEAACDMARRLTEIVSIAEAATEPKG